MALLSQDEFQELGSHLKEALLQYRHTHPEANEGEQAEQGTSSPQSAPDMRTINQSLMLLCVRLMRNYQAHVNASKATKAKAHSLGDAEDYIQMVTRHALQFLCNWVYRCPQAQEELRTSGALACVLSHCATSFVNPLEREWALLCVRNACEGSSANQAFIEELRPQEAKIQDESMKALGIEVEMDLAKGKFTMVQKKEQEPAVQEGATVAEDPTPARSLVLGEHYLCLLICSYLPARDLASTAVGGTPALREACTGRDGDLLWRERLEADLGIKKPLQLNRSRGFFRRLYLDVMEERLSEDNLVCGGH